MLVAQIQESDVKRVKFLELREDLQQDKSQWSRQRVKLNVSTIRQLPPVGKLALRRVRAQAQMTKMQC